MENKEKILNTFFNAKMKIFRKKEYSFNYIMELKIN
jgi:hypothetical protein